MEEGKAFAESLGIKFLETSAKDSVNVMKIFMTLSNDVYSKIDWEYIARKQKLEQRLR